MKSVFITKSWSKLPVELNSIRKYDSLPTLPLTDKRIKHNSLILQAVQPAVAFTDENWEEASVLSIRCVSDLASGTSGTENGIQQIVGMGTENNSRLQKTGNC